MSRFRGTVESELEILKADWLNKVDLEQILQKKAKTKGLVAKKPIETLESYKVVYRPFRRVTLNITGVRVNDTSQTVSLIDEELAPLIQDSNHRILLWRPNYSDLRTIADDAIELEKKIDFNEDSLQRIIDDMMEERWTSQELDEEMRPKLRRLQADPLTTISIILPRFPGGLRKEQVLIDERKASHAYILATSLVTNCTPRDIITSADIGERVLVETIIAIYRAIDGTSRLLVLEVPGTNSLNGAVKAGMAITRLCKLYVNCRTLVSKSSN